MSSVHKPCREGWSDMHWHHIPTITGIIFQLVPIGQRLSCQGILQSQPPSSQRGREPRHTLHGSLWFFLHDQGKDMRKWDSEPTSKLGAHVLKLRYRRGLSASLDFGEGTSGLTLQRSLTKNGGSLPLSRRRKETITVTGLCTFGGLANWIHRSIKLWWTLMHSVPPGYIRKEHIWISGVAGGS